jgi:DNA-binding NtrC family response regulator
MAQAGSSRSKLGAASSDVKPRCLTVLFSGDAKLREKSIPIGGTLRIGRSRGDDVDLPIEDKLLSRLHATVARIGESNLYELTDHQSRNGSFVDGTRVQRAQLTDGSIVRLGVNVFELTAEARDEGDGARSGEERDALLGKSAAFCEARSELCRAAESDAPVIISGEAGTGKSMAAAWLHRESGRSGPLLSIGCGASSPRLAEVDLVGGAPPDAAGEAADGYLKSCEGGTLVLDEVDLIDPAVQAMLLGILREGRYTPLGKDESVPLRARIVACTSANLEAAVEAGVMLRELFEALAAFHIELPSLRERRSDIPLLCQHFLRLEEPARTFDWSATFLEKLLLYDWPLNIRELRTLMRRLAMVEEDISTLRSAHLPKEIRSLNRMPTEDQLRASAIQIHVVPSREELEQMLQRFGGDVQRLAEFYAKDRRHIYRWLTRHDLSATDYRE